LASDVQAGQTITLQTNGSFVTLTNSSGFTNNGTIRLTGIGANGGARLSVSSGTLTNSATGLIDFQNGTEGETLSADLVNNGTITINHDVSFDKFQGAFTNNATLTQAAATTINVSNSSTLNQ